jgi:hypothetical protein
MPRGERQIVDRLQVREEVELLEDDPDALAHRREVRPLAADLLALEEDAAGVDRLQQVDAAEQRALAAPARADDDEDVTGVDAQVDAVEDDVVPEALDDAFQADHGRPGARRLRRRRRDCLLREPRHRNPRWMKRESAS